MIESTTNFSALALLPVFTKEFNGDLSNGIACSPEIIPVLGYEETIHIFALADSYASPDLRT